MSPAPKHNKMMRVLILTPGQLQAAQEGQQRTQEVQGPEEKERKKARGDREMERENKVISSHLTADAAKKTNLDNMIRINISKQYGAQDTLPKQSVFQSVSPKTKF